MLISSVYYKVQECWQAPSITYSNQKKLFFLYYPTKCCSETGLEGESSPILSCSTAAEVQDVWKGISGRWRMPVLLPGTQAAAAQAAALSSCTQWGWHGRRYLYLLLPSYFCYLARLQGGMQNCWCLFDSTHRKYYMKGFGVTKYSELPWLVTCSTSSTVQDHKFQRQLEWHGHRAWKVIITNSK